MRIEEIRPAGINRAYAEQDAASGACEELINMRLENGALRPTGDKELAIIPASGAPDMLQIYIHRVANMYNHIGVYTNGTNSFVYTLSVSDGEYSLDEKLLEITGDAEADIDIKFIGNLMVVRSGYDKKIYNFTYQDGAYRQLPEELPDVTLDFTKTDVAAGTTIDDNSDYVSVAVKDKYNAAMNITTDMILEDIVAGVSYLSGGKDKNLAEGMVGVCANFTLYDGTETKPTTPRWFCLGGRPNIYFGAILSQGNNDLHINMKRSSLSVNVDSLTVGGDTWSSELYNKYKDYIKSINIYCTKPISVTDYKKTFTITHASEVLSDITDWMQYPSSSSNGWSQYTGRVRRHQYNGVLPFSFDVTDPEEYGKALFYKQKEIKLTASIDDMDEPVHLDFSDAMLTGDTMKVENSGYIARYGQIDVYNKRLHLFDTTNTLNVPSPVASWLPASQLSNDELSAINSVAGPAGIEAKLLITTKTDTESLKTLFVQSVNVNAIARSITEDITLYELTDEEGGGDTWYSVKRFDEIVVGDTVYYDRNISSAQQATVDLIETEDNVTFYTIEDMRYYQDGTTTGTRVVSSETDLLVYSVAPVIDSRDYSVDLYVKYTESGTKYARIPLALQSSPAYDTAYAYAGTVEFKRLKELHQPTGQWSDSGDEINTFFEIGYIALTGNSTQAEYDSIVDPGVATYTETDVVTVSAQNNPTFFPPQNSYRVGGNIIAIAVNSQGVSDVQIGQYPMDVFTDNGVYALELGSGEVFYGSVVKIADDIAAAAGMVSTPYGIAFLQGDGVYLLNGRRSTRISVGLDGYVDLDIRRCQQFINAHGARQLYAWHYADEEVDYPTIYSLRVNPAVGDTLYAPGGEEGNEYVSVATVKAKGTGTITIELDGSDLTYSRESGSDTEWVLIYDIFPYLLGVEPNTPLSFREQMAEPENILIGYDNNREELWISDVRELFSYVYSFSEKSWHTVTETFSWYNVNYGVIDGYMYDITKENHSDDTVRHIQSRPLKLGSDGYKCIEQMIARINANGPLQSTPENDNLFSMYVFGSRDLRNWYMIGAAQHEGYTQSLQINKTSSKFRAFIVTAGGFLTKGSEFSSVQAMIQDFYNTKLR